MSSSFLSRRFLAILGVVGGLWILLEIGLRVGHFQGPDDAPLVLWNAERDRLLDSPGYLFQRDLGALWTLRPGAEVPVPEGATDAHAAGDVERVNADGYRGPLVPLQRPQGSLRILTLGDSATFGVGVRYEDTFSAKIESMLANAGIKAEVIDGGVGGYTLRQSIDRYRSFGRAYKPRIVILAVSGANDARAAIALGDDDKIAAYRERNTGLSGFARRVRRHVRTFELVSWLKHRHASEALAAGAAENASSEPSAADAGRPDWNGQRRVAPHEFSLLLGELRRETSVDGARFIVIVMPHRASAEERMPVLQQYERAVRTTALSEDVQVLNAHGRFEVRAKNDGREDLLLLDEWDPTPLGHDLIAQWLYPLVREQKRNRGADPADTGRAEWNSWDATDATSAKH